MKVALNSSLRKSIIKGIIEHFSAQFHIRSVSFVASILLNGAPSGITMVQGIPILEPA